jgi:glycosyltransferase involved in cell wall biosynthesis
VKVLVVLSAPPLAEGGAPGRSAVGLLRGLAAHGVEAHALAARQYFIGEPPSDLSVELVDPDSVRRGLKGFTWRMRRPRGNLGRGDFARRVRELAAAVDVIHLEETETARCDDGIETPSLVHLHYRVRQDRDFGLPWRPEFRFVLEDALAERAAIRRHRYLVCSSPVIAEAVRRGAPHAEVVRAPLSLDPRYYAQAPLDGPPVAGIIGTGNWRPTGEAIDRLANRIWPRVHERVPEAKLLVAGRALDAVTGLAESPGVQVLGEVESASAFLRGLSVLIFPLERGSGMKVKVLEALASGVPVVTTPAGAEGIEADDGAIIEQDDGALADAVVRLLRDGDERTRRGHAGRQAFLDRYSPRPATAPLVALYERMVRSR